MIKEGLTIKLLGGYAKDYFSQDLEELLELKKEQEKAPNYNFSKITFSKDRDIELTIYYNEDEKEKIKEQIETLQKKLADLEGNNGK